MKNMKAKIKTPYGTTDEIINRISQSYGLKNGGVISKSRKPCFVTPRHVVMHFLHCTCGLGLEQIGAILQRHHTSVMHGVASVKNRKQYDKIYNQKYEHARISAINKQGEFLHIPLPLF